MAIEHIWYSEIITGRADDQEWLVADLPETVKMTEYMMHLALGFGEQPGRPESIGIYLGRGALRDLPWCVQINRRWFLEYLQVHHAPPENVLPFIIGPFVAQPGGKPKAQAGGQLVSAAKPLVYAGVCRSPGEIFPMYGGNYAQAERDFRRIWQHASRHPWRRASRSRARH